MCYNNDRMTASVTERRIPMIFYFTGTGNSLAAAKKLLVQGEQLISMTQALQEGTCSYTVRKGERVGFVYPEYCSSLGGSVLRFIRQLQLENVGYVYAVATCGGNRSKSAGLLKRELKKRGIPLHNAFFVSMPNNAVTYFAVPSEDEAKKILEGVNPQILKIREAISHRESRSIPVGIGDYVSQKIYQLATTTKPFRVEDSCIGCGLCEKNCPVQAIRLEDGKPVWVKSHCDQCTACINRCPVHAIQYGKKTKDRGRYVHPLLR